MVAILCLVAIVQVNAIYHGGTIGQDFQHHAAIMRDAAKNPHTLLNFANTDPPILYATGAAIIRLTRGVHALEFFGLFSVLVSLAVLVLLHRLSRSVVGHPALRVAFLALVGFLPAYLIHSVVVAADGWSCLPFVAAVLLLQRLDREPSTLTRYWLAAALCGVLVTGSLIKYTMLSAICAAAYLLAQMVRRHAYGRREMVVLLMLVVALPLAIGVAQTRMHRDFTGRLGVGFRPYNVMSLRSILFLRSADWHVLDAPCYVEPLRFDGRPPSEMTHHGVKAGVHPFELLYPNRYSYPALLHLGTFTDLLNVFQFAPSLNTRGIPLPPRLGRSVENNARMVLAVTTAIPLSLLSAAFMIVWVLPYLRRRVLRARNWNPDVEAVLVPSLAWFGTIVVFFPFMPEVYNWGCWLPRLVLPALMGFYLLMAAGVDRVTARWRIGLLPWSILAYVAAQSLLHVSFLWPRVRIPGIGM